MTISMGTAFAVWLARENIISIGLNQRGRCKIEKADTKKQETGSGDIFLDYSAKRGLINGETIYKRRD